MVKFVDFIRCSTDYNIILHLLGITPSLKKMILNLQGDCIALFEDPMRKSARHLKVNLPPEDLLLTYGPGFTTKLNDPE